MSAPAFRPAGRARWLVLLAVLPLSTCSPKLNLLERVIASGRLTVATTNNPTTCYMGPQGLSGYECDLLQGFARKLGARLDLSFFDNAAAAMDAVARRRADLAAAGIGITEAGRRRVRFTHPLHQVVQQLVYNLKDDAPDGLRDLQGRLKVVPRGGAEECLAELKKTEPALSWDRASMDDNAESLLYQVVTGALDYTVADSDLVAIEQRYHPQLRVAFPLCGPQDLAWALAPGADDSLYAAAQDYLRGLGARELASVRNRYVGDAVDADYQGVVQFSSDARTRLPHYQRYFREAAQRHGLDWRWLAAIGYQESHWDPAAVSVTGVRGMMMLTEQTAGDLEVDRANPAESIRGGAEYFADILASLPPQVREPDRTWMALAAYNLGVGHLMDARELAADLGGDPNRWLDVRDALPLLARERWFRSTDHGYARGREAVDFVANVRNYYQILSWMTGPDTRVPGGAQEPGSAASPAPPGARS
ncbi:MAG: membrane-bound lytic murein transglycosylase MltF [Reyranella sp.]|nr:membrane-bound lytic murein transglycosylase MltF [Reyranella sp.]